MSGVMLNSDYLLLVVSTGLLLIGRFATGLLHVVHPFDSLFSSTAWVSQYQKD